ncbi:Hypothetical_protein [Hexamita inflata]|uniref:Hypothetical_protein n=1 Tax=Hexamita inflata TaxID=28002 RepID=A0AA86N8W2_9EUKA|nr:Hypothetical protein HINF_LOCUS2179 [Hexamita inflata]
MAQINFTWYERAYSKVLLNRMATKYVQKITDKNFGKLNFISLCVAKLYLNDSQIVLNQSINFVYDQMGCNLRKLIDEFCIMLDFDVLVSQNEVNEAQKYTGIVNESIDLIF